MMLVVSHVDLRRIDELAARRKAATLGASDLVRASDRRGELLRAFAQEQWWTTVFCGYSLPAPRVGPRPKAGSCLIGASWRITFTNPAPAAQAEIERSRAGRACGG